MRGVIEIPDTLATVQQTLGTSLARVERRFDEQLASDLQPVRDLIRHVEGYRGKLLRPTLSILSAMASTRCAEPPDAVITIAATCEMVHMATLVHDDVLDEAETRRRAPTVNHLRGNEAAVMLGDYLIAAAYHLCSQLSDQRFALEIGRISMVMCSGELLQLSRREDFALDRAVYFDILERKTAALIGAACRLGALAAGAPEETADHLSRFGRLLGVAFQIQDDVLDLTGDETIVGKSVRKDLEKGKLTLPLIEHLARCEPRSRDAAVAAIRAGASGNIDACADLVAQVTSSGALERARTAARSLVDEAQGVLASLEPNPAVEYLHLMAKAVVDRPL